MRAAVGPGRKTNLSVALAEQLMGIREIDDQLRQVSFLEYDLGMLKRPARGSHASALVLVDDRHRCSLIF